ncbi:MAG: hypothetical protein SO057_10725 [Atopobiaceae bacterium]|nr:hypothetical protein [Atopobiaceae bacterium]
MRCAHCGRQLRPLGIPVFGSIAWVSHEPCECDGSVRERMEEEQRILEERAMERERRLDRSGIPLRFRRAAPTEAQCIAYADAISGSTSDGLFIHGPVGTGNYAGLPIMLRNGAEPQADGLEPPCSPA